jgi:hypothetical protein
VELDASRWSGEGSFTQVVIDACSDMASIEFLRVEDAPASRSDAAFSLISNELYVGFARRRPPMTIATLRDALEQLADIGAPDYADEGMIQFLRTERIVRPYQSRGYKLIELVRIYEVGTPSRATLL